MWLGFFLLSVSWLYISPIYTIDSRPAIIMVLLGTLFMVAYNARQSHEEKPFEEHNQQEGRGRYNKFWLMVPLIVLVVWMPLELKIPAMLTIAALLSLMLLPMASFAAEGLWVSAAITAAQAAACRFYWLLGPRLPDEHVFGWAAAQISTLFGLHIGVAGATLYLNHASGVVSFFSTWDKVGIYLILVFSAGFTALILAYKHSWRSLVRFAAVLIPYALLRYTLMIVLQADGASVDQLWQMVMQIATWSLLPVALARWIHFEKPVRLPLHYDTLPWGPVACLCAAIVCVIVLFAYNEPGAVKGDRVIIDESHSNWEWTDKEYDTEWYGEISGYNYNSLYHFLEYYYDMERNYAKIDAALLKNCDVLILKTPTVPFSTDEIDCIVQYVHGGGSLFLIGDHTNVFGISANFNELAQYFGIRFRYDATYDLDSGALTEYRRPELLPHPAVQALPPFLFATSCSLESSLWNQDVITGYKIRSLDADYSQDNFFAEEGNGKGMRSGLLLQCAAAQQGYGRVVAIADSTPFSNFWLHMPGKTELFLGIMSWLNRCNTFPVVKTLAACLAVLFLGAAIYMCRRHKTMHLLPASLLVAVICALPAGFATGTYANRINYPMPQPTSRYTMVAYDKQYSDMAIPASWEEFMAPFEKQMDTFYVWNQRLGLVPKAFDRLSEALDGDVIVIANPATRISEGDGKALQKAVQEGKKLLLLGGKPENRKAYDSFASLFDISMLEQPVSGETAVYGDGKSILLSDSAWPLEGGEPLAVSNTSGKSVAISVKYGNGMVISFGDVSLFCNAVMGTTNQVPDERQRSVYDFEFWLFRQMIE